MKTPDPASILLNQIADDMSDGPRQEVSPALIGAAAEMIDEKHPKEYWAERRKIVESSPNLPMRHVRIVAFDKKWAEDHPDPIKRGDVVTLRSGGPKMTVTHVAADSKTVNVIYFDAANHTVVGSFEIDWLLKQ